MPKNKLATAPVIRVKRESWKNGLHSVARDIFGRWVTTRKWHSKKDTEKVRDIVVLKVSFPKEVKKYMGVPAPKKSSFSRTTDTNLNKYVYLLQAKTDRTSKLKYDGVDYLTFSMTSTELFEMNENNKISLFASVRHAYGDSPIKLRLLRVYNAITGETVRKYIGQRFEDEI